MAGSDDDVLRLIAGHPREEFTFEDIRSRCNISARKLNKILSELADDGAVMARVMGDKYPNNVYYRLAEGSPSIDMQSARELMQKFPWNSPEDETAFWLHFNKWASEPGSGFQYTTKGGSLLIAVKGDDAADGISVWFTGNAESVLVLDLPEETLGPE